MYKQNFKKSKKETTNTAMTLTKEEVSLLTEFPSRLYKLLELKNKIYQCNVLDWNKFKILERFDNLLRAFKIKDIPSDNIDNYIRFFTDSPKDIKFIPFSDGYEIEEDYLKKQISIYKNINQELLKEETDYYDVISENSLKLLGLNKVAIIIFIRRLHSEISTEITNLQRTIKYYEY